MQNGNDTAGGGEMQDLHLAHRLAAAEGILMARHDVTSQQARNMLQAAADQEGVDVVVVARRVVAEVDDRARRSPPS